jgi:hypothetical protein
MATKDKKTTIPARVIVHDDGVFKGFWVDRVRYANGETEVEFEPAAWERVKVARESARQAFRATIVRLDTGEMLAPLPATERLSAEERFEADKARAEEIEARRERVEEERRERERLEAEARARAVQFAREREERQRTREAEEAHVARVLAEEDARLAAEAKRADDAAAAQGIWRRTVRKATP